MAKQETGKNQAPKRPQKAELPFQPGLLTLYLLYERKKNFFLNFTNISLGISLSQHLRLYPS